MKKAFAVLVALLLTPASAATLPELFSLNQDAIQRACAEGLVNQSKPQHTPPQKKEADALNLASLRGRIIYDGRTFKAAPRPDVPQFVTLQTPTGTAYDLCLGGTILPMFLPDDFYARLNTWIVLAGQANTLDTANGWTVAVALLGADGAALAQFQPTQAFEAETGRDGVSRWEKICATDTPGTCTWIGINAYTFNLGTVPKGVQTLRVIFTRGQGREQRDYTAESFADIDLTDVR